MLSIGKISAGPQAARYYTDQVAQGRDDYYSGEGELPGRWAGTGAAAAGLNGEVDAEAFAGLLAGGGLRRPVRAGAVAGLDLTFRAPKSVSVLWGLGDEEITRELGAAHDAAVEAALGYLEREACRARRGAGGAVQVEGRGFVAAAFRHRASRAGDPLLHTHVVAGNLTLGPDERWTALDARYLYRHAKTAGFLYQAELRAELTERLGLSWEPVERGAADVTGVPREVIEHFSRRRAEILEHMAEHGGRSARSAQVAALETRRAKQQLDRDMLREQWRARASEHGLDTAAVARILEPNDRTVRAPVMPSAESLTDEASTFGRPELLQHLAEAQPQGARVPELERLAAARLETRDVVTLPPGRAPAGLTEPRFTTAELLATEHDLLHRADSSLESGQAQVSAGAVERALHDRTLSTEQQQVVEELCRRGDGISVLRAPAGTGKTYVLDAAREAWASEGCEVIGCALSARAALELHDQAAIPSVTIAELTGRLGNGRTRLPEGGVLVVDEAGMVGTRHLAQLAEAAAVTDTKLVLVGDDRQLPEIQAGGAFHALAEQLPSSELREVRRQQQPWDRQALDALRSGEVEQWARAYRERGQITVGDSAPATREVLVNDWARAEGDRLMIAARRSDVRDLNERARALLQATGHLGPDELVIGQRAFATGERVIATKNDRRAGILNGQRGTITEIDLPSSSIAIALDGGTEARLGSEALDAGRLDHGYAITAHRAQGATVDRTFVLGSEELHREWGYTAMSRHREQARFYIARGDLRDDPELPPASDPVIASVRQLLTRSNAKELALDSLPQTDRDQLERERRDLREEISSEPPPERSPAHIEQDELDRAHRALQGARGREGMVHEERAELSWRHRGRRHELDARAERNAEEQARLSERLGETVTSIAAADERDAAWLTACGPQALRLLAVDRELNARDLADNRAEQRLADLDHYPLHREAPPVDLDLGDLGL